MEGMFSDLGENIIYELFGTELLSRQNVTGWSAAVIFQYVSYVS